MKDPLIAELEKNGAKVKLKKFAPRPKPEAAPVQQAPAQIDTKEDKALLVQAISTLKESSEQKDEMIKVVLNTLATASTANTTAH